MFAELVFVFLTVYLGIFMIDKYSTAILIFVCGIAAYVVSSLWIKAVHEYYTRENVSEQNSYHQFWITAWSIGQHVTSAVRHCHIYVKIKEILSCFAPWFIKFFSKGNNDEETSSSPCRKKHCGLSLSVETELKIVIEKILHTYVRSWFCKLSQNTDFIREVNYVIEDVFLAIGNGISRMDKKDFLYHIIQVYLRFFRHYVDALKQVKCDGKQGTFEKCIAMKKQIAENFKMSHWALEDPMLELPYLQSFIANLVDCIGPVELMSSHLLQNVVVEVLTENLVSPVIDLLSDPDQLNLWVLKFLKGIAKEQNLPLYNFIVERTRNSPSHHETEQNCQNVNHITKPKIVISTQIFVSEENGTTEEISAPPDFPSDQVVMSIGDTPLRSKSILSITSGENDSVSENSLSLNVSRSSSIGENYLSSPDLLAASSRPYGNFNHSANELTTVGLDKNMLGTSGIKRSKSADCIREMSGPAIGLLPLNDRNHSIRLSGRDNKTFVKFRTNCSPTADVEQAEEAIEAEVPHLFEDVRIIDTEQKVEPGHNPYTLYCIQYWGIFHDISSTASAPDLVRQKVNVKRRFREFLALQSRLEGVPGLKSYLKGIKGPSKWLATPFSNLDKRNIAERKIFLENYLLELCKRDAIVKSTVLQEFLAYGGDASIAFVKKVSDLSVPRIDKMIFKGVKGAIGLFKTALPNTPTLSDAGSSRDGDSEVFESADEDLSSELRFPEYLIAFTKSDPEFLESVEHFFRSFGLNSSAESLYQSDLSPLDCMVVRDFFPPSVEKPSNAELKHDSSVKSEDDSDSKDDGNPMTDAMIELGVEVLQSLPWIFKTERLVFFVKNLLGPLLDLITDKVMDTALQKENCAILLHILHRAVWPEPKPSSGHIDSPLDRGHLLNEAIREYIVEVYRIWTIILLPLKPILSETFDLLLGSAQNKEMNKCLLFHMCDVMVHSLCSQEIKK